MDIAERIRSFIRTTLAPSGRVELDSPLLTGLIDSLELMELVGFLEREFGIVLEFSDMSEENFRDVRALAAMVLRMVG